MMGQFIRTWRFKSDGVQEIALDWELADMNSCLTSVPHQLGALGQVFLPFESFHKCRGLTSLFLKFFPSLMPFDYQKHECLILSCTEMFRILPIWDP